MTENNGTAPSDAMGPRVILRTLHYRNYRLFFGGRFPHRNMHAAVLLCAIIFSDSVDSPAMRPFFKHFEWHYFWYVFAIAVWAFVSHGGITTALSM